MPAELTAHQLIARHRPTLLDLALETIRTRARTGPPHPEAPQGLRGRTAVWTRPRGKAAFDALSGTRLDLGQPGTDGWVGGEVSPSGVELGVEYPHADLDVLLPAMTAGQKAWRDAGADPRDGLPGDPAPDRRPHHGVRPGGHAPGQAFMMAFQAGRPARPGPRHGGRGLRVRGAVPHPGDGGVDASRRASATRSR